MPELPELQAHAERLDRDWSGAELVRFTPLTFTALKTALPVPSDTEGHPVESVTRRGKYLLIAIGPAAFVVHLMQGGRLRDDPKQTAKPRGGVARWSFADGRALLLTEPGTERRAGVWMSVPPFDDRPPLAGLGPDADQVDARGLATLLADRSMRLHGFLRDQQILAGLGRRLANEICHRARLSPFASTAKLTEEQTTALAGAISACLAESLDEERGRADLGSVKERSSAVHGRAGEPCPVCGDRVRTVEYRSYTVAYCATCQTGGKVLADNTTSKFLK